VNVVSLICCGSSLYKNLVFFKHHESDSMIFIKLSGHLEPNKIGDSYVLVSPSTDWITSVSSWSESEWSLTEAVLYIFLSFDVTHLYWRLLFFFFNFIICLPFESIEKHFFLKALYFDCESSWYLRWLRSDSLAW